MSLYLIDVETHLLAIATNRAKNDFAGVARQAHAIVSMSGNLGATRTSKLARTLEHACRDDDVATTYRLISELQEACAASSAAIESWLEAASMQSRRAAVA